MKWMVSVAALVCSLVAAAIFLDWTGALDVSGAVFRTLERVPVVGPAVATYQRGLPGTRRVEEEVKRLKFQQAELQRLLDEALAREAALKEAEAALVARENRLAAGEKALAEARAAWEEERARSQQATAAQVALASAVDRGSAASGADESLARQGSRAWTAQALGAMKPRQAAAIVAQLDEAAAAALLAELDADTASRILAELEAKRSAALLRRLYDFRPASHVSGVAR